MRNTAIEGRILSKLESLGGPVEFKVLRDNSGFADDHDLFDSLISELVLRRFVILTKELKLAPRRIKSASFGVPGWRGCEDMPDPTASTPTRNSSVHLASRL